MSRMVFVVGDDSARAAFLRQRLAALSLSEQTAFIRAKCAFETDPDVIAHLEGVLSVYEEREDETITWLAKFAVENRELVNGWMKSLTLSNSYADHVLLHRPRSRSV
jgi:hypothetical protein